MDILVTMVSIHLEAVEQAPCVFCYHAKLTLSLEWSDGTPDAVSQSVGQVSGAADQVGLSHFLEQK